MSLDRLPVNVFDLIFLGTIVGGLLHGRRKGMSEELLPMIMWLVIVAVCALVYQPVGGVVAQMTVLSRITCYVSAYIITALVISAIFLLVSRGLGGKLLGSDIFGRSEYYLGMGAGMVRFTCILLAILAVLNARYFSPAEVRAMEKYQNQEYGSNYFPTLHTVQAMAFETSLIGPLIRNHLGFMLIERTESENKQLRQKEAVLPW